MNQSDSPFLVNRYLCGMNEGLALRGLEVPDWYLAMELSYLEVVCQITELQQKRDSIRREIRERMKAEGIHLIASDLTSSVLMDDFFVRRVDFRRLKSRYPCVYQDCLGKESRKRPGISIRLK